MMRKATGKRDKRRSRLKELGLVNRRIFSRKEKSASPKWWWDPPKLIPILISVLAVIISCLSWWEGHRGRLINEEINRPVLTMVNIEKDTDTTFMSEYGKAFALSAVLKNTGRTTAYINESIAVITISNASKVCTVMAPNFLELSRPYSEPQNILTGAEERFHDCVVLPPNCEQEPTLNFDFRILLRYTDSVTGKEYSQYLNRALSISSADLRPQKQSQNHPRE